VPQPLLVPAVVRRLLAAFDGVPGRIVACAYAGARGIPTLFERALFPELLCLRGDCGARSILERHVDRAVAVPWPGGAVDVDRPEDYERLAGPRTRRL
jgi:molybdenum cofactor cytidylyltransferase